MAVHHAVTQFAVQGLGAQPVGARAVALVTAVGAVQQSVTARAGRHAAAQRATREVGRIGTACSAGWRAEMAGVGIVSYDKFWWSAGQTGVYACSMLITFGEFI